MLTNIPDPDSLQVTKVTVIKIQISQPFQIEKKSQKEVSKQQTFLLTGSRKTLQRLLQQIFLLEILK